MTKNNNLIVEVIASGGDSPTVDGMKTDMSNLDSDLTNSEQKAIGGKLNTAVFDVEGDFLDLKEKPISRLKSMYFTDMDNAVIRYGANTDFEIEFYYNGGMSFKIPSTTGSFTFSFQDNPSAILFADDAISLGSRKISQLDAGTAGNDAVNVTQLKEYIDNNNEIMLSPTDFNSVRCFNSTKTTDVGYGNASGTITYYGVTDGQTVNPNASFSYLYFVHENINQTIGFVFIHQDMLTQAGMNVEGVNSICCLPNNLKFCLGKSSQTKPPSGVWNAEGLAVPDGEPVNSTPSKYLNADGDYVTDKSQALNACYSKGGGDLRSGKIVAKRGSVVSPAVDQPTTFVADNTSPWFILDGVSAGGGTFNVKKLFMLFNYNVFLDNSFFASTETTADGLGLREQYAYAAASQFMDINENGIMDIRMADLADDLTDQEKTDIKNKLGIS